MERTIVNSLPERQPRRVGRRTENHLSSKARASLSGLYQGAVNPALREFRSQCTRTP